MGDVHPEPIVPGCVHATVLQECPERRRNLAFATLVGLGPSNRIEDALVEPVHAGVDDVRRRIPGFLRDVDDAPVI